MLTYLLMSRIIKVVSHWYGLFFILLQHAATAAPYILNKQSILTQIAQNEFLCYFLHCIKPPPTPHIRGFTKPMST